MREVYVKGERLKLTPKALLGQGGEAEVYRLREALAVKVWKTPDHPDFRGQPALEDAAEARIAIYRAKLHAMPAGLPAAVVRPQAPATDGPQGGPVRGFAMELVRDASPLSDLADPRLRQGWSPAAVVARLLDLDAAVRGVHLAGALIGDFNERNVLVQGDRVRIIDADSFELPGFPCSAYTVRTVDPLLCDPSATAPLLTRPYRPESDWYAFAVLAFRCLLLVDPYGGVYRPTRPSDRCSPEARIQRRVTVFHPDVLYPKPALPLETLPDALLDRFEGIFARDERGAFPRPLLESLRFDSCASCGRPFARGSCPSCHGALRGMRAAFLSAPTPAPPVAPTLVRGQVTVTRLARTRGMFLCATWQGDRLLWLAHEEDRFVREDGRVVLEGPLTPRLRFALRGDETLVAAPGRILRLGMDLAPRTLAVDEGLDGPAFACADGRLVWAEGGRLFAGGPPSGVALSGARGLAGAGTRVGTRASAQVGERAGTRASARVGARAGSGTGASLAEAPVELGEILSGQGQLWLGPGFGLGFYRAGGLSVYYVFHPGRGVFQDAVALPPLVGALSSAQGILSDRLGWLVTAQEARGRSLLRAAAVTPQGAVAGLLQVDPEKDEEEARWLHCVRGASAVGEALFVPTDEGIVRVEVVGGAIRRTRTFVETEPFVDRACTLRPVPGGFAVISRQEIRRLTLV